MQYPADLVSVPVAANLPAPQVNFSQAGDLGRWKFDARLTMIENKRFK